MSKLKNKKIAFLATDGFEQSELEAPWKKIKEEGADVDLISLSDGQIQGFHHFDKADKFNVDVSIENARAENYDGLVLPGGVHNPDNLRLNEKAISFVRDFFKQNKPVAAICHGPWVLVEADAVKGRQLTSWPSIKTDIKNAGGEWVDEEVVVDSGLVTSRKPDDLEAFCSKAIEEFCEGKHDGQSL